MGLTVKRLQRLSSKGFPKLYTNYQAHWEQKLQNAVDFLDTAMPEGERILPDDIQNAMKEIIAVDQHFKKFTNEAALHQQYFVTDFCDYIIDKKYGSEIVPRKAKGKT